MDEKKERKLRVIEKPLEADNLTVEKKAEPKPFSGVSNPILKKMVSFHNEKISGKMSIKDLLR